MQQLTGGDTHRVLNALGTLVLGSEPGSTISIAGAMVDEVYQASSLPFDRESWLSITRAVGPITSS
jgi:putative ATPase